MASTPYLGAVFMFAGNFAPRGYFLCQGQLLPISQYTALFSILGTTYGGNGTSNFALPDLQCRVPLGQGNGAGLNPVVLGEKAGTNSVTMLTSNLPSHNHLVNVSTNGAQQTGPQNNFIAPPLDGNSNPTTGFNTTATSGATLAPASVTLTGSNIPLSIQNPFLGINYIIAWEGIYPSRN